MQVQFFFFTNLATVEPPVSHHPKCQDLEDLVVAYGSWSLTRTEPEGVSSENRAITHLVIRREFMAYISKLEYELC